MRTLLKQLLFHTLFIFTCHAAEHIIITPRLQTLLDDIKLYRLDCQDDPYLHAGDLYQHSIWTYNAMIELLQSNLPYAQNLYLSEREKEVVALAGLLHDIGKAGRKELFDHTHSKLHYDVIKNHDGSVAKIIYYQDHQEHTLIGFTYATHQKEYYAVHQNDGSLYVFDFEKLYNELDITNEEQKIIAILIGIHYEFANLHYHQITPEQFLYKLENLVKKVHYNNDEVDEHIVRLAILIQVANVKGLVPVAAQKTPLLPEGITCCPVHQEQLKFADPFTAFSYVTLDGTEPTVITAMNILLNVFYAQNNPPSHTTAWLSCNAQYAPSSG